MPTIFTIMIISLYKLWKSLDFWNNGHKIYWLIFSGPCPQQHRLLSHPRLEVSSGQSMKTFLTSGTGNLPYNIFLTSNQTEFYQRMCVKFSSIKRETFFSELENNINNVLAFLRSPSPVHNSPYYRPPSGSSMSSIPGGYFFNHTKNCRS